MKVLDKNPKNMGWSIECFCTGKGWDQEGKVPCGAKLEVSDVDIQKRVCTDISEVSDTYYGFTCPLCKCFTELDESKIPWSVRGIAKNYKKHESSSKESSKYISW